MRDGYRIFNGYRNGSSENLPPNAGFAIPGFTSRLGADRLGFNPGDQATRIAKFAKPAIWSGWKTQIQVLQFSKLGLAGNPNAGFAGFAITSDELATSTGCAQARIIDS